MLPDGALTFDPSAFIIDRSVRTSDDNSRARAQNSAAGPSGPLPLRGLSAIKPRESDAARGGRSQRKGRDQGSLMLRPAP